MSVYVSTARGPLENLQRVVDEHAISSANARCVVCDVEGPCEPRQKALGDLAKWHQLPRRRAGATRPELINARRLTGAGVGRGFGSTEASVLSERRTASYQPRHHSGDTR